MKIKYVDKIIKYDGSQLCSHFAYLNFNIIGDCLIAFRGPCDIKKEFIADLEEVKNKREIKSEDMLHFIGEFFDLDFEKIILRQRILVSIVKDELVNWTRNYKIIRAGDDLYEKDKKLSISVATLSSISCMIHLGINIDTKGTPVKTKGLIDYKINPENFAKCVLKKFKEEIENIKLSRCKVRRNLIFL